MNLTYNRSPLNISCSILYTLLSELNDKYSHESRQPVMDSVFYPIYGNDKNNGSEYNIWHFISDITDITVTRDN